MATSEATASEFPSTRCQWIAAKQKNGQTINFFPMQMSLKHSYSLWQPALALAQPLQKEFQQLAINSFRLANKLSAFAHSNAFSNLALDNSITE